MAFGSSFGESNMNQSGVVVQFACGADIYKKIEENTNKPPVCIEPVIPQLKPHDQKPKAMARPLLSE